MTWVVMQVMPGMLMPIEGHATIAQQNIETVNFIILSLEQLKEYCFFI